MLQGFITVDSFGHTMKWLAPRDYVRCSVVCQSWYETSRAIEKSVFKPLHEQADLLVKDDMYSCKSWVVLTETKGRHHPKALYLKYLGQPFGRAEATPQQIEEMCQFDKDGKRNYKTHEAVHLYEEVLRPLRKKEVASMDEMGRLKITRQNGVSSAQEFRVGLSIHNAIELFQHHLGAKKFGRRVFAHIEPQVLEQCTDCIRGTSVFFVRRELLKATRNKTWEGLLKRLSPNTQIAGLLPLILLCGFDILETGTCVLGEKTCARTSDMILKNERLFHLSLGHYHPLVGLGIYSYYDDYRHPNIGALTCISPDLPPPTPEPSNPETESSCLSLLDLGWTLLTNATTGLWDS